MSGLISGVTGIFSGPPKGPDGRELINAQTQANQVSQYTPTGNLVYGTMQNGQFVPNAGNTALQVTETPFDAQSRESRQTLATRLLSQLTAEQTPLSQVRSANDIAGSLSIPLTQDFSGDTQRTQQAIFEAAKGRLQPTFDKQKRQLEQRLADQGLPIGSAAYQEEMNRLEQSQGNQLNDLSLNAVQAGSQEQDRMARLSAALRGQQFNEQSGLSSLESQARASRFGEIGSLLGFAQPFTQYSTPNINAGALLQQGYNNKMGVYDTNTNNVKDLGSLAGSYFGGM